jgi:hypothetical protein
MSTLWNVWILIGAGGFFVNNGIRAKVEILLVHGSKKKLHGNKLP